MRLTLLAVVAALTLNMPPNAAARQAAEFAPGTFLQLRDIGEDEAREVLALLIEVQRGVRQGRRSNLDILAGGAASSAGAGRTAREVLLELQPDDALFVERLAPMPDGRPQYRFAFFPMGPGQAFWEVDIVLAGNAIVRVSMLNRIPAP